MAARTLPVTITRKGTFSRREYADAMADKYRMTDPQIAYDLQKRLDSGEIIRKGWGQYVSASGKQRYHYSYSALAEAIAAQLEEEYYGLDFRIAELFQLNDFMNHQMAHNTFFVLVEHEFVDSVFDFLFRKYPGRVMLKPGEEDYYRYLQDDEIVILRLPTESPKGFEEDWHIRLEQLLVDVFADKLISRIVPDEEKNAILDGAFEGYLVDEKTMVRYAKRKGADKKIRQILQEYREAEAV